MTVVNAWPEAPSDTPTVARLHAGHVLTLAPTRASLALVDRVRTHLETALGTAGWAQTRAFPAPYGHLGDVRTALGQDPSFRRQIAEVAASAGLSPQASVDAPRLRSITAGAERDPQAAPVYLLHRDTWYGCPQSLLVAWMPLHDVRADEVFAFFPEWFDKPVPNSSGGHDHTWWMREVGWHGRTATDNFASPTHHPELGRLVRWDLEAGSIVLFSAAQLHQTLPNPTPGDTRFSVDFRILPTGSTEAPNVDNDSTGADARIAAEFATLAAVLSEGDTPATRGGRPHPASDPPTT